MRRPTPPRRKAWPGAAAGKTTRLSTYLTPQEFDDAKAAYLANWTNGGKADTFARSFAIPTGTVARMRAVISADQQAVR